MKTKLLFAVTALMLFLFPKSSFAQAPNLGSASGFALFTGAGAFNNVGPSSITGDVGTNVGVFNAFPPGTLIGTSHVADGASALAATDVDAAYLFMNGITCGNVIGTTLGGGQTLTPGVYCTGAASVLNGTLTLDALGNANAIFIIKIGGALTTGVSSNIILTNSASLCNVYWQINGLLSIGDNSVFAGTALVDGAITMLNGASLQGRALSRAGAIDLANNLIVISTIPIPSGIASGNDTVCQNETGVIYTVPAITNATSYIWTVPTGATITNGATSNSIIVSFSSTAVSGNITAQGSNSCGVGLVSSAFLVTVNPTPGPAGTITGTAIVCDGVTGITYTVPLIANATSYTWTLPAGATISAGANTNTITVSYVIGASSGNITVQGSNTCGVGTVSANFGVTVNPIPAAASAISGDAIVCQNGSGSYSVPLIANANSYVWTLPTGASIISGINTNNITVAYNNTATSGVITVQGTNGCDSGAVSSDFTVTVSPLPIAAGTITGTPTVCQGATSVTYSVPSITNATSYIWTLPAGAIITAGANTNSIAVSFSNTATSGNITVQGSNTCGTGAVSANFAVTVNPLPAAAGTIVGTSPVCQGQTGVVYTVPVIANATNYNWTIPAGANITAGLNTNSITVSFSASAVNGNITVQGNNTCGSGSVSANFGVVVNQLPGAAGTIF